MDLDDLKSTWKNAGSHDLQKNELLRLTQINNHATLRGMRYKLIIEIVVFTGFLALYYDAFDGDQKPVYANVMLVLSLVAFITGNVAAYYFTKNPIQGNNIKASLETRLLILRRIVRFWVVSSIIYSVSLLVFLSSSITFTNTKYGIILTLAIIAAIALYASFQKWKDKLQHFKKLVDNFDTESQAGQL